MLFIRVQNIPLKPGHGVHTLPAGWILWDRVCLVLEQVGRDVGLQVCLLRGPGGHCAPSLPDLLPPVSI